MYHIEEEVSQAIAPSYVRQLGVQYDIKFLEQQVFCNISPSRTPVVIHSTKFKRTQISAQVVWNAIQESHQNWKRFV
jgi:hypothetical protein